MLGINNETYRKMRGVYFGSAQNLITTIVCVGIGIAVMVYGFLEPKSTGGRIFGTHFGFAIVLLYLIFQYKSLKKYW